MDTVSRLSTQRLSAQAFDEHGALFANGGQLPAKPAEDQSGISRLQRRAGCRHSVGPKVDQGFDKAEGKIARIVP
jgi:hypothetical protein